MSTTVGIDASLTGTGVVALSNFSGLSMHTRIESKYTEVKRLIDIEDRLKRILDNLILTDLVLIEGYSFGSKGKSVYQIGELGGVIRRMLHRKMIRWIEVTPSQVKKFATGKSQAKKELMIMHVYKRWNVEFSTSDEADAYVLAKIGQALLGDKEQLTQYQMEVIMELRKKYGEVLAKCSQ